MQCDRTVAASLGSPRRGSQRFRASGLFRKPGGIGEGALESTRRCLERVFSGFVECDQAVARHFEGPGAFDALELPP